MPLPDRPGLSYPKIRFIFLSIYLGYNQPTRREIIRF